MLPFGTQVFILISLTVVTLLTVAIYNIFLKFLSSDEKETTADSFNVRKKSKKDRKPEKDTNNGAGESDTKSMPEKDKAFVRTGNRRKPVTPPKSDRTDREKADDTSSLNEERPSDYNSEVRCITDDSAEKSVQETTASRIRTGNRRKPVTPSKASHITAEEKTVFAAETAENSSPTATIPFTIGKEAPDNNEKSPLTKRSASRRIPVTPGRKD